MRHTNGLGQTARSLSPVSKVSSRSGSQFREPRRLNQLLGNPKDSLLRQWREFVNEIVECVVKEWPGEVTIVNGRPRNPKCQGLVEQGNATVEKMITVRVHDDDTDYPEWLPVIQCKYLCNEGCLYSVEWNGGMERWNGIVEWWNTGTVE